MLPEVGILSLIMKERQLFLPSFLHFIIKLLDYAPGGHNVLGSIVYEQQILLEEKVFSIP
jgi:hypothetical protein